MEHLDHVRLLKDGIVQPGGIWADFGSGSGAFTLALAELIGSQGTIYSIDKDRRALSLQEDAFREAFKGKQGPTLAWLHSDFTHQLDLPLLDGLVMANALHFHRHKEPILRLLYNYLKSSGRMLLVEYNLEHSNPWIPYPITFSTWKALARQAGFSETTLLRRRSSRTMKEIYSALSIKERSKSFDQK